jgi:flavin-dependent dehydrogenase
LNIKNESIPSTFSTFGHYRLIMCKQKINQHLSSLFIQADVEARYVTRASRNLVRHTRRKLERQYGQGLVGLIHPVTKEFNHAAVINQRGGRFKSEHVSDTKSIGLNHMFGAIARYTADGQEAEKWQNVEGTIFDRYDISTFTYGWVFALQEEPGSDKYVSSNCFLASFDMIQ